MIKLILKFIVGGLFIASAAFAGAVTVFWSPDLPKDVVINKYANKQSEFFDTKDGNRVHFRDQGNPNGDALILIHGTSASLHTWEPLVQKLSPQFRLISFDLPGHGLTGEFMQRDYSHSVMVKTLFELMGHLNIEEASLLGNSLGGAIAWQATLYDPKRVKAMLLLAPSGAKRDKPSKSNIGFQILSTTFGQKLMQKVTPRPIIAKSLRQTVVDSTLVTEPMIDRYWELLKMAGNRRAMVDLVHSDRNQEAFSSLSSIDTPTLLVWGQNDQLLPVDMIRQFEKTINVSESVVLTNIGHLPQEEAVDILAMQVVNFCQSFEC